MISFTSFSSLSLAASYFFFISQNSDWKGDSLSIETLRHDTFGLLQNLENFKLLFLVCQFLLGGLDRCDAVGVLGDRHQAPESVPEKEKKSKCDDMVEST